jgi:CRISPR-associated exonuclease Cas4
MVSDVSNVTVDDDFQLISSLNHLLFCERRCALLRLEQVWVENRYTLEGTAGHRKVHADPTSEELGAAGKVARGMWLRSTRLRLVGIADVVEFRESGDTGEGTGNTRQSETPYPIEYKRGRRRKWDNDDVQLCAQGLCLEEMLGVAVPAGAIFHIKSRRRREVVFDERLRTKTEDAARRLHALLAASVTPPVVKPRCQGCSLRELCMPDALAEARRAGKYVESLYIVGAP